MPVSSTIREMIYDALHLTTMPDASSVRRIDNEITDGIGFVKKYVDGTATCEPGTDYAALLTSYVLYAEAGALDQFRENYASDILSGRLLTEADSFAEVAYAGNETED